MKITLRKSLESDLEIFFINQQDKQANFMAAFTPKNPNDKNAYLTKWKKLMNDGSINMFTIIFLGTIVGSVVKYVMDGDAEITYAVGKEYWGKGIASKAVKEFLSIELSRPIYGRVAFDNFGSQKILEKVGFERIGKAIGYANAREMEIEEFIYKLEN